MLDMPPKAQDVLIPVASAFLASRMVHHADSRIPRNANELVHWWMDRQSRPSERFDRPVQESKRDGSGLFWRTPYTDRIRHTLIKFLSLDSGFQGLIIAAAEDKIFWRGDSREFFLSVIHEHEKMRKVGVEAYRSEALRKLRAVTGRLTDEHIEEEIQEAV